MIINPTLQRKKEEQLTIRNEVKNIFKEIYNAQVQDGDTDDNVPKIKVSELISKMSFYYEKLRNAVDYNEDHLLRKNAIERILKRQIVIEGKIKKINSEDISKHLLVELIRAGYLPNNKIPEYKIKEIGNVIERYLKLKDYAIKQIKPVSTLKKDVNKAKRELKIKNELSSWIIAVAASDIEENLVKNKVKEIVISYMYDILSRNIKLPDNVAYDDLDLQIILGIYRNFMKFDRDMLSFVAFKYNHPYWVNATDEQIKQIGENIFFIREEVNKQINHPLKKQLDRIISRYTVFFNILIDVIEESPEKVYEDLHRDIKSFRRRIKNICLKRYRGAKNKLWRAAIRSIVYIFITKSIFAAMIEIPASKWLGQQVNDFALLINITFPALLLFLVAIFTKLPSDDNTDKIIKGIEEIVFVEKQRKDTFQLRKPAKRGKVINTVFGIIYAITFFISFGMVIWVLNKIGFNFVSIIIFLFFLAFVSFFSTRIRKIAREYIIIEPKESILSFLADFFYVPIVQAGKWLSERFSRINVFVFILDFIIEAPFKIFVEITEEWTKYVKERKEDIV